MPARRSGRSSVIIRGVRVGSHSYTFIEIKQEGSTRRGIRVIVRDVAARNNSCCYYLEEGSDPHAVDLKWYLRNAQAFYYNLGLAIARRLENGPADQWNTNINWIQSISADINGNPYTASQ